MSNKRSVLQWAWLYRDIDGFVPSVRADSHAACNNALQGVFSHGMLDFEAVFPGLREMYPLFVEESDSMELPELVPEPLSFLGRQYAFQRIDAGFHIWKNCGYQEECIAPAIVVLMLQAENHIVTNTGIANLGFKKHRFCISPACFRDFVGFVEQFPLFAGSRTEHQD